MRWLAGILVAGGVVPLGPRLPGCEVCEEAHRTSELTLFVALLQELNFSVTSDIGQAETSATSEWKAWGRGPEGAYSLTVQMVKQMVERKPFTETLLRV